MTEILLTETIASINLFLFTKVNVFNISDRLKIDSFSHINTFSVVQQFLREIETDRQYSVTDKTYKPSTQNLNNIHTHHVHKHTHT